jgi:Fe-S-cluster-containing hydrogenase component 2
MLSVVRFEPNAAGRVHNHPEEQWRVLIEGSCVRIQGDEEVPMRAVDFWHTPSGVTHGLRTKATGALDVLCLARKYDLCVGCESPACVTMCPTEVLMWMDTPESSRDGPSTSTSQPPT